MRGSDERTGSLFSYVNREERVRKDHPLRAIRLLVNETLALMERYFAALYAGIGRPSITPEKLLRAMLLQVFYLVRSERLLIERLEFDLLFRWFVGIGVDEQAWDHSKPKVKRLLSTDHFSVDGTLVHSGRAAIDVVDTAGKGLGGSSGRPDAVNMDFIRTAQYCRVDVGRLGPAVSQHRVATSPMTCLQICPNKPDASIVPTRLKGLDRTLLQSVADLWVAILYSGLAGIGVLAIDATGGGRPTSTKWVLCCIVPPIATTLLIAMESIVRHVAGPTAAR